MLLATLLAACGTPQHPSSAEAVAAETPVVAPAVLGLGFDPAELDRKIRPQDDFWNFVNGKWLASTAIPADRSGYGSFQIVDDTTEAQLRALVEEAAREPAATGTDAQKIGALYTSFMDEARAEALGVQPLAPSFHPARPYILSMWAW